MAIDYFVAAQLLKYISEEVKMTLISPKKNTQILPVADMRDECCMPLITQKPIKSIR